MSLADYLDGYEEFLDEHDRRALGLAPMPSQYKAAPYAPPTIHVQAQAPQGYTMAQQTARLYTAMIPAGRAVALPFGARTVTQLIPGAPVGGPALMPGAPILVGSPGGASYAPGTTAPTDTTLPTVSDPSAPVPFPTGTSYQPGYSPTPGTPPGTPSGSASGSNGLISGSTFGWLLLAAGAYWMYRST